MRLVARDMITDCLLPGMVTVTCLAHDESIGRSVHNANNQSPVNCASFAFPHCCLRLPFWSDLPAVSLLWSPPKQKSDEAENTPYFAICSYCPTTLPGRGGGPKPRSVVITVHCPAVLASD